MLMLKTLCIVCIGVGFGNAFCYGKRRKERFSSSKEKGQARANNR